MYEKSGENEYNAKWVKQALKNDSIYSGIWDDYAESIFVDNAQNVYVGGWTKSSIDFGNGQHLDNNGQEDFFIVKYS